MQCVVVFILDAAFVFSFLNSSNVCRSFACSVVCSVCVCVVLFMRVLFANVEVTPLSFVFLQFASYLFEYDE